MARGCGDSSEVVVRVLVWRKAFGATLLHGDAGQVGQARTGVVEPLPRERNLATHRRPIKSATSQLLTPLAPSQSPHSAKMTFECGEA